MKGKDRTLIPTTRLFKGLATAFGVHGYSGTLHLLGGGRCRRSIVGFIIAYCLVGFVAGLVVLVAVVSTGIALIMLKQRKGLHTKKDGRGVYIYAHSKETVRRKEKPSRATCGSC